MNETLRQAAEQVISGTTGQVIDKAGYASIGTGIGLKVAEQTPVTQSYFEVMIPHSLTEWAAVASILGALSLVIKNLFEMWWKVRESKKMAAPTPEELVSQMASRGMTITTTDASGILCLVASISECLELNYPNDECRQNAIMLWASILISANTAGRYVTSQSAPSGASQSFAYGSKPWVALYNQMKLLDTAGCTGDLVEDPDGGGKPWFAVVRGSKCK